jgi:hypothetical protein
MPRLPYWQGAISTSIKVKPYLLIPLGLFAKELVTKLDQEIDLFCSFCIWSVIYSLLRISVVIDDSFGTSIKFFKWFKIGLNQGYL